jgi:hypothetical protein
MLNCGLDYIGLGMYRELKKIEFPKESGNNKIER